MEKEELFNSIYRDHKDKIYRICCFYFQDIEDRKDLYQEILTNVWRGLETFEGRSKISTWIYRVAVNTCMAFFKKQFKEKDNLDAYENDQYPNTHNDIDEHQEEKIEQLHFAIADLNKIEKAIVLLMLEGVQQKDIAEIMGISENNIRVKIHRIKTKLRSILKTDNHGN